VEDGTGRPEPDRLEPPTPEQEERAEEILRRANLTRVRGDREGASKLIEEAVAVAPGSSRVLEAQADDFVDRRQLAKARDTYKAAVAADPGNVSAERKLGETVLALQLASDPASILGGVQDESYASGRAAALLSFLVPGLGQFVTGQTTKGVSFFAAWLVGVVWAILTPNGLSGIPTMFGRAGQPPAPIVFVPLLIAMVAWVASIGDANASAKSRPARKPERPVPPVDKPFEM
jgi:TM2 domain-containing membrane protein YozV